MHDPTYKLADAAPPPRMARGHASLLVSWGEEVRALALREGQSVIVGRAEPATFVIEDRLLSRTHARISLRGEEVTIEDLSSTNGCSVNGGRVQRAVLREGDVARLGSVEVRVAARAGATLRADAGVSHAVFTRLVADELQRARVLGRALSVVALRSSERYQTPAAIQSVLRPIDRACVFAPTLVLVLLIETSASEAEAWVDRLRRECVGDWAAGVAGHSLHPGSAEELMSAALDAAYRTKLGATAAARPSEEAPHSDAPIILSPALQRIYELVARAARTTIPVLVLGETGSGKELVARAVHEKSARASGPFKAVNCATLPANLVESLLFGHERGAFTGADKQTQGIFEQANRGSVFLDEVGELSPMAQAALLRALEQRRIVRVGGTQELEVDVRVVAATNRDLGEMVARGTFREDLLFRLDTLSLRVPPLRERQEEIVPLARLFLRRARAQWGTSAQSLSEDAVEALTAYLWPGNVRQLKNVMEHAAAMCLGDTIELDDLPHQVWAESMDTALDPQVVSARGRPHSLPEQVREFECRLIRDAMTKAGGNQAQAARALGVPRRTLTNKVHAYGLTDGVVDAARGQ